MPTTAHTHTHTLVINSYILTFDFNNGTAPEVRRVEYNSKITYPSTPTKRGSSFSGWDKEVNTMPAGDVTITAQWTASIVTIVFDRKTLGDTSALEEVVRGLPGLIM